MPFTSDFLACRQKSTEQQELERIEALQKEVAEQRKRNEASYRAALAGSECAALFASTKPFFPVATSRRRTYLTVFKGQPPKKHALSSTIPKEFHFRSDSRVKNHSEVSDASYKECDFTSQLRKHPASPVSIISYLKAGLNIC